MDTDIYLFEQMKMKHMKAWTMTAAALMAVGCSGSKVEVVAQKDMADTPIAFTAGVDALVSRAGHEGYLKEGEMGLFLSTEGTKPYEEKYNAENAKVTGINGTWTTESTLFWKNNSAKVSYSAYLPYQFPLWEPVGPGILCCIIEPSTVQTAESILGDDLLFASGKDLTAAENPGGIALTFRHKFALLKVLLTRTTEVDEAEDVINVQLPLCLKKAAMDVQGGQLYTEPYRNETVTVSMYGTKAEASGFTDTWEALLVPKTFAANEFQLTITVGTGDGERAAFRYTSPAEVKLEEGTVNIIRLTVGRDKVIMDDFRAEEWTDGTNGVGETIETDDQLI